MDIQDKFRQAGRWWEGEPYTETTKYIDSKGIPRTKVTETPSLGEGLVASAGQINYVTDHSEDYDMRFKKSRDEKVAKACGYAPSRHLPRIQRVAQKTTLLHGMSGYSFGKSSILAEELPALAAAGGHSAVLIADHFSMTGVYEAYKIAQKVGIKLLIGVTIEMEEGGELVLVAKTPIGYRNLSLLVTRCHLDEPRLFPLANWERLSRCVEDVICLTTGHSSFLNKLIVKRAYLEAEEYLNRLKGLFGDSNVYVEIERSFLPGESRVNENLIDLCEHTRVLPVAGGVIQHAKRSHFPVQDVIACIHSLYSIEGDCERKSRRHPDQLQIVTLPSRNLNAERYLRNSQELFHHYSDFPELIENANLLAEQCDPHVLPGRAELPEFANDQDHILRHRVFSELKTNDVSLKKRTELEVDRIITLGYSGHFLIAHDMCQWAKSQNIHFSARGSVVDSVVAYFLGFSRINAHEHNLHFDRFLPPDGSKRPDIDIDFEAFRREDVRQYLTQKYGKDHVATVAAVGAFSARGIVREVGKVLGIPSQSLSYLAKRVHGGIQGDMLESAIQSRPELRDSGISLERFRWVFRLAARMVDIPRNMRAHSSGVIISKDPIASIVPVQHSGADNVPIIQWDKRSAKHCFDKFDILCLRGQDVLSDTEEQLRQNELGFSVTTIPLDDESTYYAMRKGQLIGIPQSASPAMRQAHIRLGTRNLTDASLVQAGIRPGVGGAVKINEMIARRRGKPYYFDHPELEKILGNTYGIIVFQEQIDQLLQTFGGYSAGEAEDMRESIYKKRREDFAQSVKLSVLKRIVDRGFAQKIAEQVYELVSGFNGYGFAQGHALAFAEISIRCIYLQQNYPASYFTALLNSQPAGYYGPATIANEARCRGVEILGVDINQSGERFSCVSTEHNGLTVEASAIRVGFAQISGLSKNTIQRITNQVEKFTSLDDLISKVRPSSDELESLILCGALDSVCPNRRAMLWSMKEALSQSCSGPNLLPLEFAPTALDLKIEDFSDKEKAIFERRILGLDVKEHLLSFERERIATKGGLTVNEINNLQPGLKAFAVGNPIRLRFPPTQSGKRVVFFDLEDETGLLNVTCFDDTYQKDGHAIVCSPYVTVIGETQDRDGHTAFLAKRVIQYRPRLQEEVPVGTVLPLRGGDYLVG